jgi:hypothetical protein
LEIVPTRENEIRVQSGVGGVRVDEASATVGVCVAVIGNTHVTIPKDWTASGITIDCVVLLSGLRRKSPRRDVVRISSA